MIRSLRMRLFLGVTAVSALVLASLAVGIEEAVRHTLKEEFDRVLLDKARTLASMVEQTGNLTHFDFTPAQFPEFEPGPHAAYFQVNLDGAAYRRSASLGEGNIVAVVPPDAKPQWMMLPDGRRGRLLAMRFTPLLDDEGAPPPPDRHLPSGVLLVAQDSADLDRTITRLILLTAGLCAAATLLSGGALVAVTRHAIRPIEKLAREIDALRETQLATRLSANGLPTELMPVVDRLNDLLQRLEQAFARERAFTADVAHELRTPLAGLLATLEVARSRPREAPAYEGAIDKSLAILVQMQGLVENLLLLARAESGQLKVRRGVVDLEALLQECRLTLERPAAARQLAMDITGDGDAQGDREFLRIIFNNLLDNAVNYADPGTTIHMRLLPAQPGIALEISNQGHNLSPADLPRLFERFMRKDAARSATGIHAGLGLSISRQLAELQNARIVLRLEGPRFVARVELPAAAQVAQILPN